MATALQAQYRSVRNLSRHLHYYSTLSLSNSFSEYARRKKNAFRIIVENGKLPPLMDMRWLAATLDLLTAYQTIGKPVVSGEESRLQSLEKDHVLRKAFSGSGWDGSKTRYVKGPPPP